MANEGYRIWYKTFWFSSDRYEEKVFPKLEDIAKWESADKEENVGVCSAKFILQLLERLLPCTDWPKSVFGFMAQGGSLAPLC